MWERHDELCSKAEIRVVELCQNIGAGAEKSAPLRHPLCLKGRLYRMVVVVLCFFETAVECALEVRNWCLAA
jgi:hypothetical protein